MTPILQLDDIDRAAQNRARIAEQRKREHKKDTHPNAIKSRDMGLDELPMEKPLESKVTGRKVPVLIKERYSRPNTTQQVIPKVKPVEIVTEIVTEKEETKMETNARKYNVHERHRYIEANKADILADAVALGRRDALAKWDISATALAHLRKAEGWVKPKPNAAAESKKRRENGDADPHERTVAGAELATARAALKMTEAINEQHRIENGELRAELEAARKHYLTEAADWKRQYNELADKLDIANSSKIPNICGLPPFPAFREVSPLAQIAWLNAWAAAAR